MANEPIRSMKNQMYNYGIGRAFADNRPVTRGQMARAAIPESTSLIDEIKRLQMAGGLSGRNQLVENKAYTLPSFSLPNDIFSATEAVTSAGGIQPSSSYMQMDYGEKFAPDGTKYPEPGEKLIPEGPKNYRTDLAGGRGDLIEGLTERADYLAKEDVRKTAPKADEI